MKFLGVIYRVLRNRVPVEVTSWDTMSYETITLRKPEEVVSKLRRKLRGWGGTEIRDFIFRVKRVMKPNDIVIVLTDGEIFDIDSEEVKRAMYDVALKSSVALFVYTDRAHDIKGWRSIKLD